jgi:hypothetical protein
MNLLLVVNNHKIDDWLLYGSGRLGNRGDSRNLNGLFFNGNGCVADLARMVIVKPSRLSSSLRNNQSLASTNSMRFPQRTSLNMKLEIVIGVCEQIILYEVSAKLLGNLSA